MNRSPDLLSFDNRSIGAATVVRQTRQRHKNFNISLDSFIDTKRHFARVIFEIGKLTALKLKLTEAQPRREPVAGGPSRGFRSGRSRSKF